MIAGQALPGELEFFSGFTAWALSQPRTRVPYLSCSVRLYLMPWGTCRDIGIRRTSILIQ